MLIEKKQPLRLCLGCNNPKTKKELVRIVKNNKGELALDITGKMAGRGAYICRDIKCFLRVKKSKRLDKALKCNISQEIYEALEKSLLDE